MAGLHAGTAVESCQCQVEMDSLSYSGCQVTWNHVSSHAVVVLFSSNYPNCVVIEYQK